MGATGRGEKRGWQRVQRKRGATELANMLNQLRARVYVS